MRILHRIVAAALWLAPYGIGGSAVLLQGAEPPAGPPARQATVQVGGVGRVNPDPNRFIPREVDPEQASERMVLLTRGGPLLIELTLTIEGEPFRRRREHLLTELLPRLDTDGDGEVAWDEALESDALYVTANFPLQLRDPRTRKTLLARSDLNRDQKMDSYELRVLYAQYHGGSAFSISPSYASAPGGGADARLRDLLDTNRDGTLSAAELEVAESRLKTQDADNDDVLDQAELGGYARLNYRFAGSGGMRIQQVSDVLIHLGPALDLASLDAQLRERYGDNGKLTPKSVQLTPDWFEQLDTSGDGEVDRDELAGLLTAEPQLRLQANLGKQEELPAGLTITGLSDSLPVVDQAVSSIGRRTLIELPVAMLELSSSDVEPNPSVYDQTVSRMLATYDGDKNGYLEMKEVEAQPGIARQFPQWDADRNGKLFPEEIRDFYLKSQQLGLQRVTVSASRQDYPLLATADRDGDGRLGLRETRMAGARIQQLDRNGDGSVSTTELPGTIRLVVARGNVSFGGYRQQQGGAGRAPGATAERSGPAWFWHMDRNADGDLSRREFLGSRQQFDQLDKDADGLIDLQEAAAAATP